MANSQNKLLNQIISRLGLQDNEQLLHKSTELVRLLELKSNGAVQTLGDYAKATICIDLATRLLGIPFDLETGLKSSGLKKSAYNNNKRIFEKLLDLNRAVGVNEICVQLGLSQVQNEATKLLEAYKIYANSTNNEIDLSHPQYASMAVFQACKKNKVKPPKSKLMPFSHLKPTQWTMLEKNWEKFASCPEFNQVPKKIVANDESTNETEKKSLNPSSKEKAEIEDYETWKQRMLDKAYKELDMKKSRQ